MKSMKIVLTLSQADLKHRALAQAGISINAYVRGKSRQTHKNRRAAHLRGEVKHRARAMD